MNLPNKTRRPDLTATRSPLRERRKSAGISRNFILLLALIVVVGIAGVVIATSRKPAQGAKQRANAVGEAVERTVGSKRGQRRLTTARATDERPRKLRERRKKRERKERISRRGRRRGGGSIARTRRAVPRQLQMIVTGVGGERLAVVDNKQYKAGDEVEGRRLMQVGPDQVVVEYKGKTYSVRVGQQLY